MNRSAEVATDVIASGLSSSTVDHDPAWSPDGTRFLFRRTLAIAQVTFGAAPQNCDDFINGIGQSESQGRFIFLLQPAGKITSYQNVSIRLP